MKFHALLIAVVWSLPSSAAAQSLPRLTAELTVGAGQHTTRAGAAYFFDDAEGVVRIGIAYRVAGSATRAAYAKLDYVTDLRMGEKLSCTVTPTGGCYSSFSPGHGVSVALGVRQMIVRRLEVGAAAGIGDYGNSSVRDGPRPYVEGEIALHVLPRVAVMGTGRYLWWSTGGESYWYAPFMVGLQLH